jgi:uncharacterized protein YqgC (DUF456 family)
MHWIAAGILLLVGIAGVGLTTIAMPGIWLVIGASLLCLWWQPDLMSWWTVGGVLALGLLAELLDFVASMMGSAKAGGTRHGAIWSVVGGIVGAIVGSPFMPIVGTIVGGVIGAGLGAMLGERAGAKMTWRKAAAVGQGAAAGRLVSIVVKSAMCALIVAVLVVAAAVP